MKRKIKNTLCVLLAAMCFAVFASSCGVDPNVKKDEGTTKSYNVEISDDNEEKELEGFHSYGTGDTEPVTVDGVEVSVTDFSIRSYELAYLIAQPNFTSPGNIPIDPLVQFAFVHIYYKNLNEMSNKSLLYRDAKESQIKEQLKKYFGQDDFDIKKSALYNKGKNIFEMWIPEYGCNIYYKVDAVNVDKNKAEIITTFYNELKRQTLFGRTTINVEVRDGKPVITSLSAK